LISDKKPSADTYAQRLIEYLNENKDSYPLYEYQSEDGIRAKNIGVIAQTNFWLKRYFN